MDRDGHLDPKEFRAMLLEDVHPDEVSRVSVLRSRCAPVWACMCVRTAWSAGAQAYSKKAVVSTLLTGWSMLGRRSAWVTER